MARAKQSTSQSSARRPGSTVRERRVNRKKLLVAALSAVFPASAIAVPAARVEFAIGDPTAVSASGQTRALAKGASLESGDTVNTKSGRVQLRFSDGAYVSLQPQSEFRIDDYRFDGKTDGAERGFFSLLKGGLRTITGLVGRVNKKSYQVNTSVATIGIRGTEYTIAYGDGITGSVGEGEINVCTGAGCVPFASGQSFVVTTPTSTPQLTGKKTDLPPQQPSPPTPSFVAGDVTTDGTPTGLILSGTQTLSVAVISNFLDVGTGRTVVFDPAGAVTFIQGPNTPYNLFNTTDVGNNGIIAWGRGMSAPSGGLDIHYVVGLPTPATDMANLPLSQPVASYSMLGGTSPTSSTRVGGSNVGTLTGATLVANFGIGKVDATVSVAFGTNPITLSATGMPISGSTFSAFSTVGTCSVTGGGSCTMGGFFAGANAGHAGLVYDALTSVAAASFGFQGAVAFKKD